MGRKPLEEKRINFTARLTDEVIRGLGHAAVDRRISVNEMLQVAAMEWLNPSSDVAAKESPLAARVWAWLDSPIESEQDYHIRRLVAAQIGSDELLAEIEGKERGYSVGGRKRPNNPRLSPAARPAAK